MRLDELKYMKYVIDELQHSYMELENISGGKTHESTLLRARWYWLYNSYILKNMDECNHYMVTSVDEFGDEHYHCLKCSLTDGCHYFSELNQTYYLSYKWNKLFPNGYDGMIYDTNVDLDYMLKQTALLLEMYPDIDNDELHSLIDYSEKRIKVKKRDLNVR